MRRGLRIIVAQLLSFVLLAAAAAGAWAAWLGWDQEHDGGPGYSETGPYEAWQVGGLVLTLFAAVFAAAFLRHVVPAVVGPTVGLTVAAFSDWSDDESGLYGVGVLLVMMGTFVGAAVVAAAVAALRRDPATEQGFLTP